MNNIHKTLDDVFIKVSNATKLFKIPDKSFDIFGLLHNNLCKTEKKNVHV